VSRLAMNFLAKPFDNLHIRQAFALAINREKLNNDIFGGTYIPTYHIIPQGLAGYNLNLTGPAGIKDSRGNPSVAQQLLQIGLREEGWANISQMPPIKLSYVQGWDDIATSLQQMWQSVLGIKVSFNPSDFATFLKTRNAATGNPQGIQMWLVTWSSYYPDPHDWTTIHFGKGTARNNMNYGQNNSTDALQEQAVQDQLARADAESVADTRISLYQSAEQQLINQVAWIPLYQWTRMVLLKPYVKGLTYNALSSFPPMQWANIYIAAHS
jgi:oligopeptide transport system substrate-binding protein